MPPAMEIARCGRTVASGGRVESAVVEAASGPGPPACLRGEVLLLTEAAGCVDHLERGLDRPLESISTGLGRRALVNEIREHRGGCQDGEVYFIHGLVVTSARTSRGAQSKQRGPVQAGSSQWENAKSRRGRICPPQKDGAWSDRCGSLSPPGEACGTSA